MIYLSLARWEIKNRGKLTFLRSTLFKIPYPSTKAFILPRPFPPAHHLSRLQDRFKDTKAFVELASEKGFPAGSRSG